MKVKELMEILVDCDKDLDIVNSDFQDLSVVKEETIHNHRNGNKSSNRHLILEYDVEF